MVISFAEFQITLVGIDFNTAPLQVRERFSIVSSKVNNLLLSASNQNIESALIVNTCNRTEIYAENCTPQKLIDLLLEHTEASREEFEEYGFTIEDQLAIKHLFRVGCGLESQILGDVQILGQLKSAASLSQENKMLSPEFDRLIQFVIRAAKKVRSATKLNRGSSSVSYAGVHYIKENVADFRDKEILLVGTGKIGSVTCENLLKHTSHEKLTLINRTRDKAEKLADKFDVVFESYSDLSCVADKAQIIIVATGNDTPTLTKGHLAKDYSDDPKLILDLSVPRNVDPEVAYLEGISVIDIDELSKIAATAIKERESSVPDAENIVEEFYAEFGEWLIERLKYVPFLKIFRTELNKLATTELDQLRVSSNHTEKDFSDIQQITGKVLDKIAFKLMDHLKKDDQHQSVEALTSAFRSSEK